MKASLNKFTVKIFSNRQIMFAEALFALKASLNKFTAKIFLKLHIMFAQVLFALKAGSFPLATIGHMPDSEEPKV